MSTADRIEFRGWKGLEGAVPLWPMTILVGPNGSGKSSILEALALLSHLARRGNLREDLRSWLRGWPDGVFSRTGQQDPAMEAAIGLHWRGSSYRLVMAHPTHPTITSEELEIGSKKWIGTLSRKGRKIRNFSAESAGRPIETADPYESALGLISRSPERRKAAQILIDLLTRIEIYALDADFLRGTAVDTRPIDYNRKGTSLVSRLIEARNAEGVWGPVLAALRAIQPDLDTIEVREKPRGAILRYHDGREAELDEESDGFVRAAGMLLIRYRHDCPAILGFDEPENGLHLSRLVDVIHRLAPAEKRKKQLPGPEIVILATHSPYFVRKAASVLGPRMGVVSLWRGQSGRVMIGSWDGAAIREEGNFEAMVAEAFEGR